MKTLYKYWLVSTNHLEDGVWFREESDFITGMNYVAVLAAVTGIDVFAFILMSNHVHFVLGCSRDEAEWFVNEFKRRYSQYLRHKYGAVKYLKKNGVHIEELPSDGESLERAIAYVVMNCVAAGICSHPSQYDWGSGKYLFATSSPKGKPLEEYSLHRKRVLLKTKESVPGNWLFSESGYILPQSYVKVEFVEHSIFRNPQRFNYFLNTSSKARRKMETDFSNLPSFRDQVIIAAIPDICRSLFDADSFKSLSENNQTEVLRQIRYRFSSNADQLARVTGLSYAETVRLLDRYD
ncbi:MAG: hypothetical protein J5695_00895 [Bacteroidales bacterium]|nr:hypothetical protein [Bacteroidales bacterium]